jgi:mannose-6-phosphate isomerase-like protein (cupin superfamily)
VVKLRGEFVRHKHDETDDFFLVLKGRLDIGSEIARSRSAQ